MFASYQLLIYGDALKPAFERATEVAPRVEATGHASPTIAPAELLSRVSREVADFSPRSLRYRHYGDAAGVIEVRGDTPGALGTYGSVALTANGEWIDRQVSGDRNLNHALLSVTYALHFGNFGGLLIKALYFALGLVGAFLFYSGNLLWIESRRRRRQAEQPKRVRFMAGATVGACLGLCLGISAAFVTTQITIWLEVAAPGLWERSICFATWGLALAWSLWRQPGRALLDLLAANAVLALMIPLAHALASDGSLWQGLQRGDWPLLGVDIVALALACGFALGAWRIRRQLLQGEATGIWSLGTDKTGKIRAGRAVTA